VLELSLPVFVSLLRAEKSGSSRNHDAALAVLMSLAQQFQEPFKV
jgi:hypothetical protein